MGVRINGTSNALFIFFLLVYFRRECRCGSTLFITKKKKMEKDGNILKRSSHLLLLGSCVVVPVVPENPARL